MKKCVSILILFFSLTIYLSVRAQTGPGIPQIDTLTVIVTAPDQQVCFMVWDHIPGVDGYIIFHYELRGANEIWYGIDTTYNEFDTSYTHFDASPDSMPEKYRIGVLDIGAEGNFSGAFGVPHYTIYATAALDECNENIELIWTPPRGLNEEGKPWGWAEEVESYRIYVNSGGNPYQLAGTTLPDDTFFIYENLVAYSEYCFRVTAVSTSGRTTTSNEACLAADMPRVPSYINADFATVDAPNTIRLSFHADPEAETTDWRLLRRPYGREAFDTIQIFPQGSAPVFEYTDRSRTDIQWEYQMAAMNACGKIVCRSNLSGNIVLSVRNDGFSNQVWWNNYREWQEGTDSYTLYRRVGHNTKEEIALLFAPDTIYVDDITSFRDINIEALFCYTVDAAEAPGNPYFHPASGISNETCLSLSTDVFFPNAIVPNSSIPENRIFRPVFIFYPAEYHLVIYNRWNNKVFESFNPEEGWDGSIGNKSSPREGAYVYYCRVEGTDGTVIIKNGTVSVLFRR